jgi:FG-GAP-like repeat
MLLRKRSAPGKGWFTRLNLESLEERQLFSASWPGYALNPQHTAQSAVASQDLQVIRWRTPVDLNPQYSGNDLLIHYGSPLITPSNTVIVPVKTGASGGFEVEALQGSDGSVLWTESTDYILPPHNWVPSYSPVLTPHNRLYFAGAGGTIYYLDNPDTASAPTVTQIAFYGISNYTHAGFDGSVFINTPITSDSAGDIFFGFMVTGANPLNLVSGLARIGADGTGSWVSATAATADASITKVVHNNAPALSNDGSTVYVAMSNGNGSNFATGYLVALDSTTLATKAKVALVDPKSGSSAYLPEDGTASPTVGPDGDVYFGVLENPFPSNHDRGWMLHFSGDLSQTKTPGAFGWDDTASIVPASMVPSYAGTSSYLIMTKYNNYANVGGDGMNKLAVLDPNATETDPITGATVMKEVLTVLGPTANSSLPGVDEWCINTAAVDPATKSILVNSEDGKLYRWDMTTNTLTQTVTLTAGIGEAYTPTLIGPDGAVYAINNATLFAVDAANHFSISAPASTTAGTTFSITVTALDVNNQTAAGYRGTVHFTSSDTHSGVVLPTDYTLTAADAGVHSFTGVTLDTAGSQTVTATDTVASSITGVATVIVNPAAASHLTVTAPSTVTANAPFSITVTALDPFQNIATGYNGTVKFATSDAGPGVVLPANYTFVNGDAGVHTFTNGVTLQTAGTQTVSAQDTATSSIQGSATMGVQNPVPVINNLSITSRVENSAALMITITGSGFVYTSNVQWNGMALATTFVSGSSLQATIPAADLKEEGTAAVTVANVSPGGGTSNSVTFTITDAGLTANASGFTISEGKAFSGAIGSFADANVNAPLSDFTGANAAKIDWGDGTPTTSGTVTQPGGTGAAFMVSGNHTYAEEGTYTLALTITDAGGSITSASASVHVLKRDDLVGQVSQSGQWWVGVSNGSAFSNNLWATWNPAAGWTDVQTGDFNGDGRADIVGRDSAGNWWVGLSNGSSFTTTLWGRWNPNFTWVDVHFGDFTGDGRGDIVGRVLQSGQWWVAQSTGSSFVNSLWATWNPNVTWVDVKVGDFNGDGKADIVGRVQQSGQWWVGLSTSSSFMTNLWATWNPNITWVDVQVGDFNGDGKADIASRVLQSGQWWVGLSNGSTAFNTTLWTTWNPNVTWEDVKVGDFNGDGQMDIIGRVQQSGQWWVAQSTGTSFVSSLWATWNPSVTWVDVQVGDFNGDGKADIAGRVAPSGQWWAGISNGSSTFNTALWTTWNATVTWVDVHAGDVA